MLLNRRIACIISKNNEEVTGSVKDDELIVDFVLAETPRLYLREFNIDDVDSVYAYAGDPETTYFMDWGPESYPNVQNFVLSVLKGQILEPRRVFEFAICLKDSGRMIGACSLYLDDACEQAELGYILHRDFHHQSLMTEAAKAVLRFGFMNLNLHRIHASCDSMNAASENVMKRIGMRKEAEMKSCCHVRVGRRKQWRSKKVYAMLQKEYLLAELSRG